MNDLRKRFIPGEIVEPTIEHMDREIDEFDAPFAVHYSQAIMDKMVEHAVKFKHTEVFGLLLGRVVATPSGKLRTLLQDFIAAQHFHKSTVTFVEVSAEELIRMDRAYEQSLDKQHLLKIGWFHTHPGHGIFMSQTDKDNHSLYRKKWQIALVIDPVRQLHGFFYGSECTRLSSVIVSELPAGSRQTEPMKPASSSEAQTENGINQKSLIENLPVETPQHSGDSKIQVACLPTSSKESAVQVYRAFHKHSWGGKCNGELQLGRDLLVFVGDKHVLRLKKSDIKNLDGKGITDTHHKCWRFRIEGKSEDQMRQILRSWYADC